MTIDREALKRSREAARAIEEGVPKANSAAPPLEPFPLELFMSCPDFLAQDFHQREPVVEGLLVTQTLTEIFARRGDMKTWTSLELALAVSGAEPFLAWPVPKPRRVLYIDGEMAARDLQDRLRGFDRPLLTIVASEMFSRKLGWGMAVNTSEHQERLRLTLQHLEAAGARPEVLIFDNLSSLTFGYDENEGTDQELFLVFMRELRHAGYTVIYIHHAGKDGTSRGHSRRQDPLDLVIKLTRSEQNKEWVVLSFDKIRGKPIEPPEVIMAVTADEAGRLRLARVTSGAAKRREDEIPQAIWILRTVEESDGKLQRKDIAKQFAISKSTANEHVHKLIAQGLLSGAPGPLLRVSEKGRRRIEQVWPEREL